MKEGKPHRAAKPTSQQQRWHRVYLQCLRSCSQVFLSNRGPAVRDLARQHINQFTQELARIP